MKTTLSSELANAVVLGLSYCEMIESRMIQQKAHNGPL